MAKNSRGGHLLERAAGDARQIVAWRAAGYSVTRRNCESYGMSRRRWVWAVGLLKLARVLGDQVTSADTFSIEDVEECAEAIERAVRAVESRGARDVDHAAAEGGGEDAEGASTEVKRPASLRRRRSLMVLRLSWSACQRSVICRIHPG